MQRDFRAGLPAMAAVLECDAVILDGYHFADDEMFGAFKSPCRRIWVDDFGNRATYLCDAVVNFTVGAQRLAYPETVENCYLGPNYFPARLSLRALRVSRRQCAVPRRVLVAIGGFDRGDFTARACQALAELDSTLHVTAALGSRYAWKESLTALKKSLTLLGFQTEIASMFPICAYAEAV
jgi:spore coat polysaccharide biosynthesis predicted glycosyltransferase SpsG